MLNSEKIDVFKFEKFVLENKVSTRKTALLEKVPAMETQFSQNIYEIEFLMVYCVFFTHSQQNLSSVCLFTYRKRTETSQNVQEVEIKN